MGDIVEEVEALCQAIRTGGPGEVESTRREFVARNWGVITVIDKLAHAHFSAGQYELAARKLELITELVPDSNGFFLRRVHASIRAGVPGALEELAGSAGRILIDHDLFHAIEHLLGNSRPDLATSLLADCRERDAFSSAMLAAAQSRILHNAGRTGEAIALLKPQLEAEKPHLLVMRCAYLMMEDLLDFAEASRLGARTVLSWAEEWDVRHVVDRLLYTFRFTTAERLLGFFVQHHPDMRPLVTELLETIRVVKNAAQAALDAYGGVETVDPTAIHDALSRPETPALRVLWGKQALVALLQGGRMTEADYSRFAWYLPNWEEGLIRDHVLASARQAIPQALAVRRGWLRYLVRRSIHGDASRECLALLADDSDEDTLFFAVMLLRLDTDGVRPSFMGSGLFEDLRRALLSRVASTGAGFRCVMQDHLVALGSDRFSWPEDGLPALDSGDATSFRRLFAVTTGRLGRVSTGIATSDDAPIRPILAISGQLRGFETVWPSLYTHLCRPLQAPVVVTVWDKSVNATGRHAQRLERALPPDIVARLNPEERYTDAFEQAYPETFKQLFGQTDVDAASLRDMLEGFDCDIAAVETESERAIEQLMPGFVSANMLKMYYKFARIEALVQEREASLGVMYSHVVWTRPDCEILSLATADLRACLKRADLAWSSFTNENTFGDYVMILPRRAFSALAAIFTRVVTAGDTLLMPWRPNRSDDPRQHTPLAAFGGPDVIFDTLLAAGYVPLNRIPRMDVRLVARTPPADVVRRYFEAEQHVKDGAWA